MATIIPRDQISQQEAETIKKVLTITPTVSFIAVQKFGTKVTPLSFWFKNPETNNVHLPMAVGYALKKKRINDDKEYFPTSFTFKGSLREHQVSITNDAITAFNTKRHCIISSWAGSGKTIMGAYLSSHMKLRTVILCHRELLLNQWANSFKEFTTINHSNIWIVGENDKQVTPQDADVIISMTTRVSKIPQSIIDTTGLLLLDEAHCLCTQSAIVPMLSFAPKYLCGLSATPKRDDGMEQMIHAMCGPDKITMISTKPYTVYKYHTGVEPTVEHNANGINYSLMTSSLCSSDERNTIITKLAMKHKDEKILILTSLKSHVDTLVKTFTAYSETVDFLAGSKGNYKDSRILVGTLSKIGTVSKT